MPGKLTTHVLDLTDGRPAAGIKIELLRLEKSATLLKAVLTNADGRTDPPLLLGVELVSGEYEMIFHVREYFAARNVACPFLDRVPVRFSILDDAGNYHV